MRGTGLSNWSDVESMIGKSVVPATPTGPTKIGAIPGIADLWAETLGDPRICIAVLDGPVELAHPSLAGANLTVLDTLVSGTAANGSAFSHGTYSTSVIFGQPGTSVQGFAPRCRGLIVPIFDDGPAGSLAPCSQLDLARAITQAAQAGANVLNISAGQLSPSGKAYPLLADAVRTCADLGILIVAAAGNDGCSCVHVPGALASVLAVGAMNTRGEPLEFSNWGDAYQTQGILAPGENVPGAAPGGRTVTETGTSCATAVVSGVAGLLLSVQIKGGQRPDVWAVRAALLDSALACEYQDANDCRRLLMGRLNIPGAAARVASPIGSLRERGSGQGGCGAMANETSAPESTILADAAATQMDRPGAPVAQEALVRNPTDISSTPAVNGGISPTTCGCGCASSTPAQLVYALGALGYDFGTESRRDSIAQHMAQPANPYDTGQILAYLDKNPWDASSVIWTLNLDATPIYAVQADGAFASETYGRLRQFLREQIAEGVERVSIPGWITGRTRLFTGQVVPIIHPVLRGMYSWTVRALVEAACGKRPAAGASQKDKDIYERKTDAMRNFLHRIYYEFRNLGVTPEDRARNYAGTNALLAARVFEDAVKAELALDTIGVERSPICRPESDCWDVNLTFFDPKKTLERAREVYQYTVDASEPAVVMVGKVQRWSKR
jgi:cyanobactin maturation PatA/PatG family protease